jgi:hypothetical protein
MINAFVPHNTRRTGLDGMRQATINRNSQSFERFTGSESLTSLWSGGLGMMAAG